MRRLLAAWSAPRRRGPGLMQAALQGALRLTLTKWRGGQHMHALQLPLVPNTLIVVFSVFQPRSHLFSTPYAVSATSLTATPITTATMAADTPASSRRCSSAASMRHKFFGVCTLSICLLLWRYNLSHFSNLIIEPPWGSNVILAVIRILLFILGTESDEWSVPWRRRFDPSDSYTYWKNVSALIYCLGRCSYLIWCDR